MWRVTVVADVVDEDEADRLMSILENAVGAANADLWDSDKEDLDEGA